MIRTEPACANQPPRSDEETSVGVADPDTSKTGNEEPASSSSTPGRANQDVIYLPNKDGVLVAVPYNSKYEEYIDWIAKQDALPIDKPYTISSVTVDGNFFRNESGKEYLAATVEVRLTIHTDGWLQIPLEMGELIVGENMTHEGTGDFVFDRRDAVQGMIWWAKGKGKHRLKLAGYVPVRRRCHDQTIVAQSSQNSRQRIEVCHPRESG